MITVYHGSNQVVKAPLVALGAVAAFRYHKFEAYVE